MWKTASKKFLTAGVFAGAFVASVEPAQLSQNIGSYVLFAENKLTAKSLSVAAGDLGVRAGTLAVKGLAAPNSQVVADKVKLPGSTCGALFANRAKGVGSGCGPASAFTGPVVSDLATACGFPAPLPACDAATPVTVAAGETTTLPPGVYGDVGRRRPPAAGTLVLSGGGRYVFCNMWMAPGAHLVIQDGTEVDVVGKLQLGAVEATGDVQFFAAGPRIKLAGSTRVRRFCAPNGVLATVKGAGLMGSFAARVIKLKQAAGMTVTLRDPNCGNGTVDVGEACDDGNNTNGDACEADCTLPTGGPGGPSGPGGPIPPGCGNATLDAGEACDDGNNVNADDCEANCTLPVCGNAIADGGEECDDGNTTDGDGCQADCTTTPGPNDPRRVLNLGTLADKTANSTSITLGVTGPIAAGDAILVAFAMDNKTGGISVVDNVGNVYTCDLDQTNNVTSTRGVRTALCSTHGVVAVADGAPLNIRVNHPSATGRAVTATEFVNVNAFEVGASDIGNSIAPDSSLTPPLTKTRSLLFMVTGVDGAADALTADKPPVAEPKWNLLPNAIGANTGGVSLFPGYRIVGATKQYKFSGRLQNGASDVKRKWVALVGSYYK